MKLWHWNSLNRTRHLCMALVALGLVWTMCNATSAVAQPKNGPDHKDHGKSAEHAAPRSDKASEHANHGPDKGERPNMMRGHEHDGTMDAGMPHGHGGPPEAIRQRIEELQKKGDKLTPEEKQELERLRMHRGRLPWAERKARLEELKSKMDAGKLTEGEQSELDKLQKMKERHDALEATHKANAESRKSRAREAKRQALREMPNVGKDPAAGAEYRKHAERMAKLERAKELATANEDTELLQKIDGLLAKEQQRHGAWLAKHQPAAQGGAQ